MSIRSYLLLRVQLLRRCIALSGPTSILPDSLLSSAFVSLKCLDLRTIHHLHDIVRLPFLEGEPEALVAVVFVIGLIFVVLHLDEVAVDGVRGERERD